MPIAKETSAPRNPIPAGVHHGICYAVIDLGTQPPNPNSQFAALPARKVLLMFELPEERIDVERDGVTRNLPRALSKEFTLSLHEKAGLRKFLVAWRGKQFTPEELKGFDLANVLGVNAMINIVHNDKGYENIQTCTPLMKGMPKRKPENMPITYDIETRTIPAGIPAWIAKKIAFSAEHMMSPENADHNGHDAPPHGDSDQFDESEIPF